ncbi:MAG: hypothetical protein J7J70_10810 [Deltaproteobacteria bacterium]|nr:hypothetical protein [Candidatus Tharpellaceae bacterium]
MAAGIRQYQFSQTFKKGYNRLLGEIQKAFNQKLELMLRNMTHPFFFLFPFFANR